MATQAGWDHDLKRQVEPMTQDRCSQRQTRAKERRVANPHAVRRDYVQDSFNMKENGPF